MQHKQFFLWISILSSLLLTFIPTVHSDSNPEPQTKQLDGLHEEVQVNLVNVYLTAVDSNDAFVTDLKPEELSLKEDGIPQHISNFDLTSYAASDPLTMVILIDTSMSMNEGFQKMKKIEMAKKGALQLIEQIKRDDRMMLIRFSDSPADATGLISERNSMKEIIRSVKADNGLTTLLDAIDLATKKLKDQSGQKLMFICSDGEDNASQMTKDEVFEDLRSAFDLTVVALGINAFQANGEIGGQTLRDGRTLLQSIADNTGGYAFFPKDLKELDRVMEKLKSLIASQYSLGYHPSNMAVDGSWRKIEITCSRPGVKLKYRTGYYSK
jgi:Ca-activated chloride channel homolog